MKKYFGLLLATTLFTATSSQAAKLVVYSSYEAQRLAPILEPFTQRTGIAVDVVNASSTELLKKLEHEGEASMADLYLDKDIVYLGEAQQKGLLQEFSAAGIPQKIPAHLMADDKTWFLLFYRSRAIMYNTEKVNPAEIKSYADLGNEKWEGQLCLRTSTNSYSQGLAAFFIQHWGEAKTTALFSSWVKNLAVEPLKGDTDLIKAIANGTCAVGIANTYYLAPLVRDDASFPVRVLFPEQKGVGAHINGVGIGITKSSKNLKAANLFLEFLASKEVQEAVAAGFSQYPASREADRAPILKSFGTFVEDTTNVSEIAKKVSAGQDSMSKAGYK